MNHTVPTHLSPPTRTGKECLQRATLLAQTQHTDEPYLAYIYKLARLARLGPAKSVGKENLLRPFFSGTCNRVLVLPCHTLPLLSLPLSPPHSPSLSLPLPYSLSLPFSFSLFPTSLSLPLPPPVQLLLVFSCPLSLFRLFETRQKPESPAS